MNKIKHIMLAFILCIVFLVVSGCLYLGNDKFGKLPVKGRLAIIEQSPNYYGGYFHNQLKLNVIVKGGISISGFIKFFFHERDNPVPLGPVPIVKTDVKAIDKNTDMVVWLGHSSYYIQLQGKTILIDPVFSSYASPFFFSTRAFEGTNCYAAEEMPDIDYLLISHDHWDHLDYDTVRALRPKVRHVVTGLGVGEHFALWGYPREIVHEQDWDTTLQLEDGLTIHVLTARHFSGRWLDRNKTLWVSFALETPSRRIYYSGDSGYGPQFKAIGERFGGFDLVLLDSGQYNEVWQHVHMMPEQSAQAAEDLNAKAALPSHAGKFSIAYHSWDDPFRRFIKASQGRTYRPVTPRIGEVVFLDNADQVFSHWWE